MQTVMDLKELGKFMALQLVLQWALKGLHRHAWCLYYSSNGFLHLRDLTINGLIPPTRVLGWVRKSNFLLPMGDTSKLSKDRLRDWENSVTGKHLLWTGPRWIDLNEAGTSWGLRETNKKKNTLGPETNSPVDWGPHLFPTCSTCCLVP